MKKMRLAKPGFLLLTLFCLTLTVSCASDAYLPIPGEGRQKSNKLSAEYFTLAQGFEQVKNYTKAIEYYELAMRNETLRESAKYKLARCYALGKNWEKAEEAYTELLSLDPDNTNLKLSLAYIYANNGSLEKALESYRELKENNPHDVSIRKNYIAVLMADGKYEVAEEEFNKMKEEFPDESALSEIYNKLKAGLENTEPYTPSPKSEEKNK